jgi:hypothetical protein
LTKVLKESPSEDDAIKHTGNFKGEVHFIWMFILRRYLEQSKDIVPFEKLWKTVVESIDPESYGRSDRQMDFSPILRLSNGSLGDSSYSPYSFHSYRKNSFRFYSLIIS